MRSFIIASIILVSMLTLILINSFCVIEKINGLLALCEKAESSPSSLEMLVSKWVSCRDYFALSINHDEIDRAESALISAVSYALCSEPDFSARLEEFKSALRHIADAQKLSLSNIL